MVRAKRSAKLRLMGVGAVVLICALAATWVKNSHGAVSAGRLSAPEGHVAIIRADTEEKRRTGLSATEYLPADNGMLFEFEKADSDNCFWMNDMKFAIDMVWMDASKRVITVREAVGPDTYPTVFCPKGEARYGLELASGVARTLGVVEGVVLKFK